MGEAQAQANSSASPSKQQRYTLTAQAQANLKVKMESKKTDKQSIRCREYVRLTGLEPARLATPDPKSGASTNSATGAVCGFFSSESSDKGTLFLPNSNAFPRFISSDDPKFIVSRALKPAHRPANAYNLLPLHAKAPQSSRPRKKDSHAAIYQNELHIQSAQHPDADALPPPHLPLRLSRCGG